MTSLNIDLDRVFYDSIMVAGGITKYGLSHLIFCSGSMNNFSYKQFLIFMKKDMDEIKKKYNLKKDLLFQQDNAPCHKSRESLDCIDVIFGKNKIWWPANSPDLSPIETVWAIVKQELSKKKNNNLDDLRNNLIDIWSRFPNELCEKIVAEFDDKIRICQKEEGKILNKILLNKYSNLKKRIYKEENGGKIKKEYDWETIKRDRNIRIAYNDKIIEKAKKKIITVNFFCLL